MNQRIADLENQNAVMEVQIDVLEKNFDHMARDMKTLMGLFKEMQGHFMGLAEAQNGLQKRMASWPYVKEPK